MFAAWMVALTLGASATAGPVRTYQKEFPVAAGARFSLASHKGTITVRIHGEPVVRVEARIYPDEGRNPELVDQVRIREQASADGVSLAAECDASDSSSGLIGGSRTLPLIDWNIALPDDAELELDSHKSRFDVDAPAGRVEIQSHKGEGEIRGVRDDLRLETHKGSFRIEVERLTRVDVETHKGHIDLLLHRAADFTLRGESYKGSFRVSGRDAPVEHGDHQVSVDYREGNGRNRIDLSTYKGEIEVRFVD